MHIVITRPKEDSLYLIENLIKLGHTATHLPVIKIEKLETKKIDLLNYKAVIFTSSNAIRFMDIEKFNSKIKCFCVGKATEFTAKQIGFINTYSSEGTVDSLIELIIRTLDSKSGKLLYLSSEFISKDLDKDLINAGYTIAVSMGLFTIGSYRLWLRLYPWSERTRMMVAAFSFSLL